MARYGEVKPGLEGTDHRRVGARVRELRLQAGMTHRDIAEEMRALGHRWTAETSSAAETGRRRGYSLRELWHLSRILDVPTDTILSAIESPDLVATPPVEIIPVEDSTDWRDTGKELGFRLRLVGHRDQWPDWRSPTDFIPGFNAAPGQRKALDRLAEQHGISRPQMIRRVFAVGIPAFEEHREG